MAVALAATGPPWVGNIPRGGETTHPGATEVHLKLTEPGRATLMKVEDRLRVERSPALFGDLKALLGPTCLAS